MPLTSALSSPPYFSPALVDSLAPEGDPDECLVDPVFWPALEAALKAATSGFGPLTRFFSSEFEPDECSMSAVEACARASSVTPSVLSSSGYGEYVCVEVAPGFLAFGVGSPASSAMLEFFSVDAPPALEPAVLAAAEAEVAEGNFF